MTDQDALRVKQYVCARCGTVASTDSRKEIVDEKNVRGNKDSYRDVGEIVWMKPRCPCGCMAFTEQTVICVEEASDRV